MAFQSVSGLLSSHILLLMSSKELFCSFCLLENVYIFILRYMFSVTKENFYTVFCLLGDFYFESLHCLPPSGMAQVLSGKDKDVAFCKRVKYLISIVRNCLASPF